MVFAAGLGTRLRPLTDRMPKALVPVCGKPLLWHVLMKLKASGINDVVVNVHHFADMITGYLKDEGNFGMNISISDERDMLRETGGGIRHAGYLLYPAQAGAGESCLDEGRFLVHNADIISDLDIGWLESEVRSDAVSTLLVSERETTRYLLFNEDMRLVGWTNVSTGEVRSPYPGLDAASCRRLAFSGIHVLSSRVFSLFGPEGFGDVFPIMDFYLKIADRYPVYGVEARGLHLVDVGKPGALPEAERILGL